MAKVFINGSSDGLGLMAGEHSVEVTADSLYEAVAQGLRVFRENDWVDDLGRGQTISVVARHPEITQSAVPGVRALAGIARPRFGIGTDGGSSLQRT